MAQQSQKKAGLFSRIHKTNSNCKKRRSKDLGGTRLDFQKLEPKNLLAGITLTGGVLQLEGGNASDFARVTQVSSTTVRATLTGHAAQTFAASDVNEIRFLGRNGDDSFTNGTSITSRAYGHAGSDRFTGGSGRDYFQGGNGNDTLVGGAANDGLRGNGGNDVIRGGTGHDGLYGGDGNDRINGEAGNDRVSGNNGADTLNGNAGRDRILGGAGADVMNGGAGFDTIVGGVGGDVSVYGAAYSSYNISASGQTVVFSNSVGQETNVGIETFRFADGDRANNNPNDPNSGNNGGGNNGGGNAGSNAMFNNAEVESLSLLNSFRTSSNRSALPTNTALSDYAESWARTMGQSGFRHSSDSARNSLARSNNSTTIAENIAFVSNVGQSLDDVARQLHDLWRESATHRENMLSTAFTEVGVGIVLGADNRWYGAHIFAG